MERTSFVFYLNWHKILKRYPAQVRYEVYDAIMEYAASGTLTDLKPQAQMAFDFIRDEMDKNLEKYETKVESRRKAANERWNREKRAKAEDVMQKMQMHNLHSDNDNEYDNEYVSSKDDDVEVSAPPPSCEEILKDFLEKNRIHLNQAGISEGEYYALGVRVISQWELSGWEGGYIKPGPGDFSALKFIRWLKTEKRQCNETTSTDRFQKRRGVDTTARTADDYTGAL